MYLILVVLDQFDYYIANDSQAQEYRAHMTAPTLCEGLCEIGIKSLALEASQSVGITVEQLVLLNCSIHSLSKKPAKPLILS